MKNKNVALLTAFILCLSLLCALPCAALDKQHVITHQEAVTAADGAIQHAWAFTINKTAPAQQLRLNVYSSGALYNNCRVTTYLNDNTRLQWWGGTSISSEGEVWCPFQNPYYSLQIYRSGATPEASVYLIEGNRFGDVNMHSSISGGPRNFYVSPRYIHAVPMYLQETSAVPGAGGGKYCRWVPDGATTFHCYDVSLERYWY